MSQAKKRASTDFSAGMAHIVSPRENRTDHNNPSGTRKPGARGERGGGSGPDGASFKDLDAVVSRVVRRRGWRGFIARRLEEGGGGGAEGSPPSRTFPLPFVKLTRGGGG